MRGTIGEALSDEQACSGIACSDQASAQEGDGDDDEDADDPERKELFVQRVLEILGENNGCVSMPTLSNDSVVKELKPKNSKGWLRAVLAEREDVVKLLGTIPHVCLLDVEPDSLESRHSQAASSVLTPSAFEHEGPPLVDPTGLPPKKCASLYQNKVRVALAAEDITLAERLVQEALYRHGITLNAQVLNWIVHAHSKGRRVAEAAAWLERMEPEFKIKPTERTFSHVLDGFAANGDLESAEVWLLKMSSYGLVPDIRTLNGMIKACCRMLDKDPDLAMAEGWFNSLADFDQNLKPDGFSFGNLIYGCMRRKNVRRAAHWFSEMISHGIAPSAETCTFAFDAAGFAPREDRDFAAEFAERTFECMRNAGLKCDKQCRQALGRALGQSRAQELDESF